MTDNRIKIKSFFICRNFNLFVKLVEKNTAKADIS